MKNCNKCRQEKPLTDFQHKSSTQDGYAYVCRVCDNAARIQRKIRQGKRLPDPPAGTKRCGLCQEIKPLTKFYARKSGPHEGKPYAHCIPCVKAANTARSRAKGVPPRNPADPEYAWKRRLGVQYSMTAEEYKARLDSQGGVCPGCGRRPEETGRRFAVDHDHRCCPGEVSCGRCVRGLLCYSCNFVVGHAYDSSQVLEKLATYLREHAESEPLYEP